MPCRMIGLEDECAAGRSLSDVHYKMTAAPRACQRSAIKVLFRSKTGSSLAGSFAARLMLRMVYQAPFNASRLCLAQTSAVSQGLLEL